MVRRYAKTCAEYAARSAAMGGQVALPIENDFDTILP